MITAASVQLTVGNVIAFAITAAAVAFVLYRLLVIVLRKDDEVGSEIELAPNRKPYFDDAELESGKLDRSLLFGLLSLTVIAVALPFYWLGEPGRRAGAEDGFLNRSVSRGATEYAESCTNCHGANGQAGAADVTITDDDGRFVASVAWAAPALNTVLSRFDEEEVRFILNYGRNGVMPAWGAPGGGPMTTQQIDNLIAYLGSIQLSEVEIQEAVDAGVRERKREVILEAETDLGAQLASAEDDVAAINERIEEGEVDAADVAEDLAFAQGVVEAVREEIDLTVPGMVDEFIAVATAPESADPASPNYSTYLEWGSYLFTNQADGGVYGCARCHTAGWSYNAAEVLDLAGQPLQTEYIQGGGAHGPNLTGGVERVRFPNPQQQIDFINVGSELGVVYGTANAPKTGGGQMPGFGGRENTDLGVIYEPLLTQEQIAAVVAYEREL